MVNSSWVNETPKYKFSLVLNDLKRVSKPGRRVYVNKGTIPRVLNGMGIAIIATSKGVISNKKAKFLNIGGEVLCHVW